jgi:hypothetical protein
LDLGLGLGLGLGLSLQVGGMQLRLLLPQPVLLRLEGGHHRPPPSYVFL